MDNSALRVGRQAKLKRKRPIKSPATKSSRTKLSADALPWKSVKTASFSGVDGGGGMMMLEELDDVDVEWEEHDDGRKTAHFVTSTAKKIPDQTREPKKTKKVTAATAADVDGQQLLDSKAEDALSDATSSGPGSASGSGQNEPDSPGVESETAEEAGEEELEEPFDDDLLPQWSSCSLHADLKRALLALGFITPTEIQKRSLPLSTAGRDVVGVAETGSGKTLSYALPILSHLLRSPKPSAGRRPLSALMLCPTRELALQVVDHLQSVLKQALPEKQGPPRISIGSVIGGLSAQKQKRIVERGCDILVATPGRLWDLMKSDDDLASGIRGIRFLVIDEADRMIENGHFAELENIVRLTERQQGGSSGVDAADAEDPVFAASQADVEARPDMQTFIFSATLSKELQQNLKKRKRLPSKKGGKKATALEDLVERLDFRDPNPAVIDLSPEGGVVASLRESMVECVVTEKDLYLYYFLLRYPGRSLVFVGSIDGIRRLVPLFEVLQVPVYPLHSQLQQKQRLKNLDRFKSSKSGVLIATDVAARGLDIPHVEHVVHFNLPRTADAYIHRSGRTARAQNPGFALQLVSAEDKGLQRALMKSLERDVELPELPIENGFLPKLKERIRLAREIEKAQHGVKKENHDKNWLLEAAEALDVDIDPGMLSDGDDPDRPYAGKHKKGADGKVANLKAELRTLLAEPLVARGVSARYPTSGSKIIIDDLISAKGHPTLLGAASTKAYDEVHTARPAKKVKRGKPKMANGK